MSVVELSAEAIYRDLSHDIHTRSGLNLDVAQLSVDDFASRYGAAIRAQYAKDGYDLDPDECYELAARLWRWMQTGKVHVDSLADGSGSGAIGKHNLK